MTENPQLRWATDGDDAAIADTIFDAVRNGPSRNSEEQRRQWVPERRSGPEWSSRLAAQHIIVAEAAGKIVGLMSLAEGGYIDFAFIRPGSQGTGLFRRLFAEIERKSEARGDARLWTHASLMAEPAFAALGFAIVEEQTVAIGHEQFRRFEMGRSAGH